MSVKSTSEKIEVNMGKRAFSVNLDLKEKIKEYEDYIILTPFASVYYLGKTVEEIVELS